jgi:PAS domain S-box-containing protein
VVHIGHVCTPVLNDKGHFLGTRISNRDITKRKEAEKELFESEQRYRCLIETANEGIIVAKGRRLVFVNPMMLELTGYSQEEMLANDFLEFVCNEDWDLVLNNQLKRLSGELADPRYQLRIVRKDKSIKWVDMNGVKIEWEGEPATMNFVTDITERKRVEAEIAFKNEELLRLNSEKDKFFSIIAHDLRGPFSGFLGLTQIMANQLADLTMDELQQIAISMKNSATNLSNLLENLLEWSLVHQGLMPFNPKILKLRPIADESISIMQEPAKSKDIEIINNISDDTMVFADSNLLQTVIRNLVSNAVKFTHKGGNIRLYSRTTEERRVEISIHDSGIGISPKMLNQLFRLDSKTNRNGTEGESSSGLGLLLCKGFVEKHGGKLWAESEEGKGSTFYFTIPFKNEMAS